MIYFANEQRLKMQLAGLESDSHQNWIQFKLTTSEAYDKFVGMEDEMHRLKEKSNFLIGLKCEIQDRNL